MVHTCTQLAGDALHHSYLRYILSGDLAIYKQHRTNFQLYAAVFQPFVMVSMFVCSFFVMVGFQFYFMGVYVFVSDSLVVQSSTVIILLMV